jgi:hypothetical protein
MATKRPQHEKRLCKFCEAAGYQTPMLHHKPLRDHWYCTTCCTVEIDWPPIYRRVELELLYEYPRAKARLSALPAAPVARYDIPRVDGGLALSQQEAHVVREQDDHWVVHLVESLFRCGLTQEEKQFIMLRYWERWGYRQIADRMNVAVSTVFERRESALQQIARAAKWA